MRKRHQHQLYGTVRYVAMHWVEVDIDPTPPFKAKDLEMGFYMETPPPEGTRIGVQITWEEDE